MIDPTHTTPLSSYRHNELLRQAEHARRVRLARLGRPRRPRPGLRFRLPAILGRLLAPRPSAPPALERAPAREDTPTAA